MRTHYPGEPKPGYVAPWEETPDWERQSASAVFGQVLDLLTASNGAAGRLADRAPVILGLTRVLPQPGGTGQRLTGGGRCAAGLEDGAHG